MGKVGRLLVAAVAVASLAGPGLRQALAGQPGLVDGGFEASPAMPELIGAAPPSVGFWSIGAFVPNGPPVLVTDPVHSGAHAAQLDTRQSANGRTVFQDVTVGAPCYTWTFHVNRGEGTNWAELVDDWRGGPSKGTSTLIIMSDAGLELRAWSSRKVVPQPLAPGAWHELSVYVDGSVAAQTLSVDGVAVLTLQASAADRSPETMILGDVAGTALHGLYTYDDVSLEAAACGAGPAVTPGAPAPTGTGAPAGAGSTGDGAGFPWWLILVVVAILILLLLVAARRRRRTGAAQG